jgi:hypothetical protein
VPCHQAIKPIRVGAATRTRKGHFALEMTVLEVSEVASTKAGEDEPPAQKTGEKKGSDNFGRFDTPNKLFFL